MAKTRSDLLRRRPNVIRYYFMAVTDEGTLHTGMSYGGLDRVVKNANIVSLYVSDVVTSTCFKVPEDAKLFMRRWAHNYNDPDWNYAKDLTDSVSPPRE